MHQGSTLQSFLADVTERLGKPLKLRIQLAGFDAMCRMIGAGVGVGIVPESVARRNREGMKLSLVRLTDDWSVRERYVLVRDQARLPPYAPSGDRLRRPPAACHPCRG
jgi:DNA-binding transcriptional LysR family regulator